MDSSQALRAPRRTAGAGVRSEIRIRDQIRSGRSLVGKGSLRRGCRLLSSGEASRLDGHPSVIAAAVAPAGPQVFAKSSPANFSGARDNDFHTSAQDEQSRSGVVSVSAGISSGDLSGHPLGQSPGQPCDSSSAWCAGRQHSSRTPARQRDGAPTSAHIAPRRVTILMREVYTTIPGRSTKCSVTFP